MALKDHVIAMESRDSHYRGNYVAHSLRALGLAPAFQSCRLPHIRNIIVDLPANGKTRRVLFSAHYDVVEGTPAANDNASGVAVLLGLCQEMVSPPISLRIVFFDREEAWFRTPLLKLGLLGSLFYAITSNRRDVAAVYNLEFVGIGDLVGIWPVKEKNTALPIVMAIKQAASRLNLPVRLAQIPWLLMSSDHLSFRLRGINNAVTISLLPSDQTAMLDAFLAQLTVTGLTFHHRQPLPEPLALVHTGKDTSANISEDSLQLALSLLKEIIRDHASLARQTIPSRI